jgi:hypothetical protein
MEMNLWDLIKFFHELGGAFANLGYEAIRFWKAVISGGGGEVRGAPPPEPKAMTEREHLGDSGC